MAKLTYVNKSTGKSYTTDSEGIKQLKSNPVLASAFSYEAEQPKPAEVGLAKSDIKIETSLKKS